MTTELLAIAQTLLAVCSARSRRIVILPHVGLDADALGSGLALDHVLTTLGGDVQVITDEAVPHNLTFLPLQERARAFIAAETVEAADLALMIDCDTTDRLGLRAPLFDQAKQQAVLDHHLSLMPPSPLRFNDPGMSSTGEIVFNLIQILEQLTDQKLFDQTVAELLLAALMADTGRFAFSNTTPATLRAAAELWSLKPRFNWISRQLFNQVSRARFQLSAEVGMTAEFFCQGRGVIGGISLEQLSKWGGTDADLQGLPGELRVVEGVEVAFLLREFAPQEIRVNIRSSEHFNAADFARRFGGGGHARAAGCTLTGQTLEAAWALIREAARPLIEQAGTPTAETVGS